MVVLHLPLGARNGSDAAERGHHCRAPGIGGIAHRRDCICGRESTRLDAWDQAGSGRGRLRDDPARLGRAFVRACSKGNLRCHTGHIQPGDCPWHRNPDHPWALVPRRIRPSPDADHGNPAALAHRGSVLPRPGCVIPCRVPLAAHAGRVLRSMPASETLSLASPHRWSPTR